MDRVLRVPNLKINSAPQISTAVAVVTVETTNRNIYKRQAVSLVGLVMSLFQTMMHVRPVSFVKIIHTWSKSLLVHVFKEIGTQAWMPQVNKQALNA